MKSTKAGTKLLINNVIVQDIKQCNYFQAGKCGKKKKTFIGLMG